MKSIFKIPKQNNSTKVFSNTKNYFVVLSINI